MFSSVKESSPQPNVLTPEPEDFSAQFWLLVIGTGAGAGVCAGLLMKLLRAVQHFAWSYSSGTFLAGVSRNSPLHRVTVLVCAGVLTGLVLWLLQHLSKAKGGDLSASIWFQSGRLPLLKTVVRALLSIVIVGMGFSLGREEAPKQAGALIGSRLALGRRLSPFQRRFLTACGAGAGMAAVYNVPLGGSLFILEVLLGSLSLPLVLPALACCVIATAVGWLFLPPDPTYVIPIYKLSGQELLWATISGPLLGLGTVLYIRLITFAHKRKPGGWTVLPLSILVCTALGIVAIVFPQILGNGRNVTQQAMTGELSLFVLCALLLLKPLATALCLGTGAPGGLFTPTIASGALLGGLLGKLWTAFAPGLTPGSSALIGAGAVLAAATQGPLSAIVLTLELTQRVDTQMVPLLIAVTGAMIVSRAMDVRSIYSGRVDISHPVEHTNNSTFHRPFEILTVDPARIVFSSTHYAAVLEHLLSLDASAVIYVINDKRQFVGEISRATLQISPGTFHSSSETKTAADLARPVHALYPESTTAERDAVTRDDAVIDWPVTDQASGILLGTVKLSGKQYAEAPGRYGAEEKAPPRRSPS